LEGVWESLAAGRAPWNKVAVTLPIVVLGILINKGFLCLLLKYKDESAISKRYICTLLKKYSLVRRVCNKLEHSGGR